MKWNAAHAVSAVFVLALTMALARQAHAACGNSQRIDFREAECLEANWNNNRDFWSNGKVEATNLCATYGTVVAKIDIKAGSDKTWYLTDGETRSSSTGGYDTRNVWCCSDLSDFCDRPELNDDTCRDQFQSSSARETCWSEAVTYQAPGQCRVEASCQMGDGRNDKDTTKTASWHDTADLSNCNGTLQVGGC